MGSYVPRRAPVTIGTEPRPACAVPKPPGTLSITERRHWRILWATPVAETWSPSDAPIVSVLARLLARLDEGVTPGIAGQIANISAQLGLSPRSRRVLSIQSKDEPAPPPTGRLRYLRALVDDAPASGEGDRR